ncbi:SCY1-like protein bma [Oratosquilla oratoria]|uniref:SCY1-like protein bma n=1 Tax=Oratosquilla oratoria TaxID=337810 RepID=UPI003F775759
MGKLVATGGPGVAWKIYEGYRKSDAKEVSVWVFEKRTAEKIHKPRRRETVTELLRNGIKQLDRYKHPRLLQVVAGPVDTPDTLSFYSEPIYGSLANIICPSDEKAKEKESSGSVTKDYNFLEVELKYGILQLTEALSFLHYTCHVLHRNVNPNSVFVTKKGTWKLAGLEFAEKLSEVDGHESLTVQAWTSRTPKITQPDLDYMAPEIQITSQSTVLSDMFSLGMIVCSIFNSGKSLIEANNSSSLYLKQLEVVGEQVNNVLPKIPLGLQEAVVRLVSRDVRQRPTSQLVALIKYFSDPVVHALQFLDVINMKDPTQKGHFYRTTLMDVLPHIPKKLWFLHVWPSLQQEMRAQEVLAAVLQPILYIIAEVTTDEYENIILPHFRGVFNIPKTIQASVTLLENIHIILQKTPQEDIATDILPIIYSALESSTGQVQVAAVVASSNASEFLEVESIKKTVLPRTKAIYERNPTDIPLCLTVLGCLERILDKLEKSSIIDDVLPILYDMKLQDADVTMKVVNIYRLMMSDKKHGLSINLLALRVLPSLLPQTVSPSLNLEQFNFLLGTIQEMLDLIDKQQRNKLKLDNLNLSSPGEKRLLRHQLSSDNMALSPFPSQVPNVRIQDSRMSSSAEDVVSRRGSSGIGYGPSSPDSHLLRVQSAFIGRRLSDNELMMPPKIRVAPSAASSPGETSTGSLPIRRHSSIGPERRGSTCVNLSPPTVSPERGSVPVTLGAAMTSTSKSVPLLLTPSTMASLNARRTSTCSISSLGGADSRRSSAASVGTPVGTPTFKSARRPSALISNSSSGNLLQQLSSGVVSSTVSINSTCYLVLLLVLSMLVLVVMVVGGRCCCCGVGGDDSGLAAYVLVL